MYRLPRAIFLLLLASFAVGCSDASSGGNNDNNQNSRQSAAIASIEVDPSIVLDLQGPAAVPYRLLDADGQVVAGEVSWEFSTTGVAIEADGGLKAADIGQTTATVSVGDVTSDPIQVLVLDFRDGVVLVADAQVVSAPVASDTTAAPLEAQAKVVLTDVELEAGDLIASSGAHPIAGRVISATDIASGTEVTFQVVPLTELVSKMDWSFEALAGSNSFNPAALEFEVGPFECEAESEFEIDVDGFSPTFDAGQLSISGGIQIDETTEYLGLLVAGPLTVSVTGKVTTPEDLSGEVSCELELGSPSIPVPFGVLATFLKLEVPIALVVDLEGSVNAQWVLNLNGQATATVDLGYESINGVTTWHDSVSLTTDVSLTLDQPDLNAIEVEVSAMIGPSVGLSIDPTFIDAFELLTGKVGPKWSATVMPPAGQADDLESASESSLTIAYSISAGDDVNSFFETLGLSDVVGDLELEDDLTTLYSTPTGTMELDDTEYEVGDTVVATISMEEIEVAVLGYLVDAIKIYRVEGSGAEATATELAEILPDASGQTEFVYEWEVPEGESGEHTWAAFVVSSALPLIPLEIEEDSTQTFTVGGVSGPIVFAADGDIWRTDLMGGDSPLTSATEIERNPRWNHDYSQVVYQLQSNPEDVWVVNADGSGQQNLTDTVDDREYLPVWSPHGTQIAYARNFNSTSSSIIIMGADGSAKTPLSTEMTDGYFFRPRWSPDGSRILFSCDKGGGVREICVVNADGSGFIQVSNNGDYNYDPEWSPDGGKIVWTRYLNDFYEIYIMNADGTGVQRLTNTPQFLGNYSPRFTPDGANIVFTSDRDNTRSQIYIMNADGANQTSLTPMATNANGDRLGRNDFAISSTGDSIAYTETENGQERIWVMNLDGTGKAPISQQYSIITELDW